MDDEETRSTSPSKLTARQRAKGNKDLQETLVSLPGKFSSSVLYSVPLLLRCLPDSLLVPMKVQGQAPLGVMSSLSVILFFDTHTTPQLPYQVHHYSTRLHSSSLYTVSPNARPLTSQK